MKKPFAVIVTALLTLLGLGLILMGAVGRMLSAGEGRYTMLYILAAGFLVLVITGAVSSRAADPDYRKVIATLLYALGIGLFMLFLLFGLLWMLLSGEVVAIVMAVMLPLYGIALVMAGVAHHFMAQKDYRPFMYHFFQELPYLYYRYRT